MRVKLKGIHTVRQAGRLYRYAWRGGPRLKAEPGTAAFIAEYHEAVRAHRAPPPDQFRSLIALYKDSSEFRGTAEKTRRDYLRYIRDIENRFGDMPLVVLDDPRIRQDFKAWRDGMADRPRTADLAWSVLARILSVAFDRGLIASNPCRAGGRLYRSERRDSLWTEPMIAKALSSFPEHLRWPLMFGLWTGQRQGDLLRLPWSAYEGDRITLRQDKRGARVPLPVSAILRAEIARIPRIGPLILTNSLGRPWTSDGFRSSWRDACQAAEITGVTFHDLRGSAVTRLGEAGCTAPEIASITGHSMRDVETILDSHYLGRTAALAENAIRKLETRTESVKTNVKRRGAVSEK